MRTNIVFGEASLIFTIINYAIIKCIWVDSFLFILSNTGADQVGSGGSQNKVLKFTRMNE